MCYFIIGNLHRLRAELRDRGLLGASVTVATAVRALQVGALLRTHRLLGVASRVGGCDAAVSVSVAWVGGGELLVPSPRFGAFAGKGGGPRTGHGTRGEAHLRRRHLGLASGLEKARGTIGRLPDERLTRSHESGGICF